MCKDDCASQGMLKPVRVIERVCVQVIVCVCEREREREREKEHKVDARIICEENKSCIIQKETQFGLKLSRPSLLAACLLIARSLH